MNKKPNPFLEKGIKKSKFLNEDKSMTIKGTYNKTFILLLLLTISFIFSWNKIDSLSQTMIDDSAGLRFILIIGVTTSIVLAFTTIFKPKVSPITAPMYAMTEGALLGFIVKCTDLSYPGIALPAVLLTIAITISTLLLYKSIGPINKKIVTGIIIATVGILILNLFSLILSLAFGIKIPLYKGGIIGIIFSLLVIVIATLNLIVDLDSINELAYYGAPKYMEWYSAFGVLVTLVWLYLEILNLIQKLKEN
ncbi:Bax inhibitor-1/YccA family protein [Clostridium sporogenes]|uniref:Bax inhibitor-1/YccA family protein n=2 Tax=Clostridium TaxID=1485 RepID=A0A077K893_CLOBO|nr:MULTISPECIES: Bax inhibitor-1/YccA family protein [Clostridium]AJD29091.1 inhibitor of apoptosis-promoting Bax1 family protein [Clostridium botulinum Prevot_594]AJE13398.1 inhibitor of apoptosis-promoting Bax1 family protein [Clostridium botulinum CDC_1436]MBO0526584.1 Bax inhibitor-1/YccA family protein [Clostridium botulinum]MBO0528110.1 Bax inhibitor-1/YccA family protein [Clostridium botulinum]MBO0532599.1 Bax inhibitor-1/YccA family protein [Clostridium botulinum]